MDELGFADPLPQQLGSIVLITDKTVVGTVELVLDNGEVVLLPPPR